MAADEATRKKTELGVTILDVLRGPLYQTAREAIIHYETIERERATSAIIELRDALDHMWHASQSDDPVEVASRVSLMTEHFRRAAVEPAQDMVESRLHRIYHNFKWYEFRRVIDGGLPSRKEVDQELVKILENLEKGRVKKARVEELADAMKHFGDAHVDARNLNSRLEGSRLRATVRITLYLLPLGIGIAALVVAIFAL